ncbi:hypothetical protein RCJ22_26735 [Vibrio sp. FNV 38]|nr:hypothetical protein [Vibrio sp. FNV 38]
MNSTLLISLTGVLLLVSNTLFADDRYVYTRGYGDNQKEAIIDAKQSLAKSIFSKVEVYERSHTEKNNNETQVFYEQTSSLSTIPIDIQKLELQTVNCDSTPCEYLFRVDKQGWAQRTSNNIANNQSKIRITLANDNTKWRDLMQLLTAQQLIDDSNNDLAVLFSLDQKAYSEFASIQHQLEQALHAKRDHFTVDFRSSPDSFSTQVASHFATSPFADSNGKITIYIKSSGRQGTKGNLFVAKQTLLLTFFDDSNLSVAVSQKELSEVSTSVRSKSDALHEAQAKIIEALNKESIFRFLKLRKI